MFRTLLSYLVLILVPAVSLGIAVGPYLFIKKKYSTSVIASRAERGVAISAEARNEIASSQTSRNDNTEFVAIPLRYLWGAFFVGLVGNVGWWSLIFWITNDRISIYLGGTDISGIMIAFFIYSFFLILTPFVFHGFQRGYLTAKSMIVNILFFAIITFVVIFSWPLFQLLNSGNLLIAFLLLTFLLPLMPFILHEVGNEAQSAKRVVYHLILSLLIAGLVVGVWIVLAIIGYRGLFYQLN